MPQGLRFRHPFTGKGCNMLTGVSVMLVAALCVVWHALIVTPNDRVAVKWNRVHDLSASNGPQKRLVSTKRGSDFFSLRFGDAHFIFLP